MSLSAIQVLGLISSLISIGLGLWALRLTRRAKESIQRANENIQAWARAVEQKADGK